MKTTWMMLGSAALLSVPAQAQTTANWERSSSPPEVVSVRECHPPADAKEAQVLAFDRTSLEAKLAVNMGKGEFKVATIKLWDRSEDTRPIIPVIEAARITQGKLQFFTPNLNADPEPVHDKQFLVTATLGGAQICWATESSLLKDTGGAKLVAAPTAAPEFRKPTR